MTYSPDINRYFHWLLIILLIYSQHVGGTTPAYTGTTSAVTTSSYTDTTTAVTLGDTLLNPPGASCDSVPDDYCKNNGTCRQPRDEELWECSGDAGTGPLKCDCPPTHTGSRCETELSCDSLACLSTEICDYNWSKQKLECIPKDTSGKPPECRDGVQEVNFQFNPKNLEKHILCLDMYEFNMESLCKDLDDSLTYFISEGPQELPNLFCLVVDYQTYKTCLRVNATHRNSITMTSAELTIIAEEYSVLERNASLKLRVIFNTPPTVQNSVIQWVANTAETMALNVIAEAEANGLSELRISDFSFSNKNLVTGLVKNRSFLQLNLKGTVSYQIRRLTANITITDSGIPQLSTSVTIQITLVRLKCQPIDTLLIDRRQLKVDTTLVIGQVDCKGTTGYALNYDIPSVINAGLTMDVNSAKEIIIKVDKKLPPSLPETGKTSLIVSFNKFSSVRKMIDIYYQIYYYTLIWFETDNRSARRKRSTSKSEIETEINNYLSPEVSIHLIQLRDDNWVDVVLKSNLLFNLTQDENEIINDLYNGGLGSIQIDINSVGSAQKLNYIFAPVVTIQGLVTKIFQGSSVIVQCEANFINVLGKAELFWTLNGIRIQPTPTSRFQTLPGFGNNWKIISTLQINDVKNTDKGSLGCHVRDVYGFKNSSSQDLPVISLPIVSVSKTVFVRAGREIELTCEVVSDGGDTTTLKWLNAGSKVADGAVLKITSSVETERSCVGSNSAGQGQPKVVKIFIIAGAACTSGTDSRNTAWLQAAAGKTSQLPCPSGYDGIVRRKCSEDGDWLESDYSSCIQSSLVNIKDQISQLESGILVSTPDKIMSNMSSITKQTSLNSGEVVLMTEALKDLTTIMESRVVNNTEIQQDTVTRWASEAVNLVGNLIEPKQNIEDVQIENTSVSLLLLNTMDDVSKLMGVTLPEGETTSIVSDNIVLTVGKIDPFNVVNVSYPGNQTKQKSSLSVDLPSDIFTADEDLNSKTYSIIDYDNLTSLPAETTEKLSNISTSSIAFKINSDIVSVNIFGDNLDNDNLPAEVVFTFSHLNSSLNSAACSFWNVDYFAWDNSGCRLISTNQTSTTCSCNHLTNFALLMKPTQVSLKDEEILSTITLVGATISICCLLVTLLVYAFVWRYVKSDRAILLVHLCFALMIALLLFLFGIDKTENSIVCTSMAVCLHYFYLVVFFLMLGEGIEVLVTIVKVFSSRSKLRELVIMGWGVPLIIVAISGGVTELEGYGNEKFCWLSIDGGLIWAFLGPALFIIVVNLLIVIKITHALLNTRVMINKDTRIKAKAALRSICVLLPVMGVAWVFGVLSVNEDLVVFDYIFTIFNSLQGLFIFIFHCVINRKVREGLASRRRRYRSRHTSLSAQKSGSRSAFDKSRNSRKRPSGDEAVQGMMLQGQDIKSRNSRRRPSGDEVRQGLMLQGPDNKSQKSQKSRNSRRRPSGDEAGQGSMLQGQDNAGYFGGYRMDEIPRKKPIERLRYPSFDDQKNYFNHFPEVSDGYSNLSVSGDPSAIIPIQSLTQSGLSQEYFKPAIMRGNSVLSTGFSDRSGSSNSEDISAFKGLPRPRLFF